MISYQTICYFKNHVAAISEEHIILQQSHFHHTEQQEMMVAEAVPLIKKCTKAGSGYGGFVPMIDTEFESGHAYGKSLRTVKSCVGSTWCRFGVDDAVSFAIQVEERYKGSGLLTN